MSAAYPGGALLSPVNARWRDTDLIPWLVPLAIRVSRQVSQDVNHANLRPMVLRELQRLAQAQGGRSTPINRNHDFPLHNSVQQLTQPV